MPLLAALTPSNWQVSHTDEITHSVDTSRTYDLVGITAATPGAPHAYELAEAFRRRGVKIVIGGPHATLMPYEVIEHADIVVVGEAEPLWSIILRDVEYEVRYTIGHHILDEHTQANVEVLPANRKIYRCTTPATLDKLPFARRDLIQHGGWNKWWTTKGAIIATRGCPHQCDYCTIPHLYPQANRMRFRPVEEVAAEVETISSKGIVFWDDNIGANPRYAKVLFRALIPLKKWWTSQTTITSLRDDEFLHLAAESGCKALFIGLESIYQHSLDGANKSHNQVQNYKRLIEQAHSYKIAIQAGIMFGFDADDKDVFARTVDIMGQIGLDNATISLMVPYPGTPAYVKLQAVGRIIDYNWRHYNGKTHVVHHPKQMTPDALLAGYEWAKTQFYSPGHIVKRLSISQTGLWWNIPRNLGYMFGLTGEVRSRAAMHTIDNQYPLKASA
jgi:radical SAM superfamily enzyme YgiQ (UPF0313 family)